MSDVSLSVSDALVETVAHLVAERVAALLTERAAGTTPWMTTDEAIEYTRIPAGTFEELSARGRIPFHAADSGRRKRYHRD
jgi:excisionase family DNA binding protein